MKHTLWKPFAISLVAILLVLAPACRKKTNTNVKVVPDTATHATDTVPPVPAMVPNETKVDTQPPDFVSDAKPAEEELPRDIDQLNRVAQDRGYIKDAYFEYDAFALSADAQSALTASAQWLRAHPDYNLLVEGHCDERGTEQYNLALGDRRANTVKDFLAAQGVDAGRIRTVSYGEERPFDEGHDESSWVKNRRAHLVLVK